MEAKMKVLFCVRKSKAKKCGLLPIYLRVTINGERFESSTNRFISETKWSGEAGKVKGTSVEARSVNSFLETLLAKAYDILRDLIHEGKFISISVFKAKWLGTVEKSIILLEVFQGHNDKMQALVGHDYGGEKWLMINRQKTDSQSGIPLLAPALNILKSYEE